MTKVLVSDPIDKAGIEILSQVAQVDQRVGLSLDELKKIIGDYDALMIRSGTQVTTEVIEVAEKLRIIGGLELVSTMLMAKLPRKKVFWWLIHQEVILLPLQNRHWL